MVYLLAKVLEQCLRRAGLTLSVAQALETLEGCRQWSTPGRTRPWVVKATKREPDAIAILAALGLRIDNPVIPVTKVEQSVA